MSTQSDMNLRVVSLNNLRAMCDHVSAVCHRFQVVKVSRSRIHVQYSNPNEYGTDQPLTAVFPCFPSHWPDDAENPRVILELLRVLGDSDGEGWQSFEALTECPTMWREGHDGAWSTHAEIRASGRDKRVDMPDTCTVCDIQ